MSTIRRSNNKKPFIAGPADEAILRVLLRYYYLTNTRVTRLLYSGGSASLVRSRLKRLADAGYCLELFLPRPSRGGSSPTIYRLSRKGLNLLTSQGTEVPRRYRLVEEREHSYLYYLHTLACNDFLIGAELLARRTPSIELAQLIHERDLKRHPAAVTLSDGTIETYMADGWLEFRLATEQGRFQQCFLLELDHGTMGQAHWRRKIAKIVGFSKAGYEQQFGTTAMTVAVVPTHGEKRRDDLLRWTEAELEAAGEQKEADLFRFTALAPETDPETLFLSRAWQRPLDAMYLPLLSADVPLSKQGHAAERGSASL